ncbi:MAG: Spy/CpxP family protein refolding chaperone [Candidatus Omnitrophota bacterium]
MKRKQFFIILIVVMWLGMILSAQPFMGKEKEGPGMGKAMMEPSPIHMYKMLEAKQKELKLSDTQLEQIKTKAFALEEKIVSLKNANNLLHLELKKLMMEEKTRDYNKISDVLTKISANRQAIFIESLKTKDAIHGILTPEQREAIKDAMRKRFDRPFPRGKGMKGMKGGMKGRLMPPCGNPPGEPDPQE